MKKFFVAIFAIAAATACSNNDIISINNQKIGFDNPFVENSVRATDTTYSTTNTPASFQVFGTVQGKVDGQPGTALNIFNNVTVTKEQGSNTIGNTGTWWYNEDYAQYWVVGAAYNFAAVVDATISAPDTNNGMPVTLTTVTDEKSNVKDLLYAEAAVAEAAANQGVVGFAFNHLLSKVKFTVTSTATGNYKHNVKAISVKNYTKGTFTLDNAITPGTIDAGTWVGNGEQTAISFGDITGVSATNGTAGLTCEYEKLLIPTTASFDVAFTVELYNGDNLVNSETKTVTIDTDLVKGNAYNFTIACSVGAPITFTFNSCEGWGDDNNVQVQ